MTWDLSCSIKHSVPLWSINFTENTLPSRPAKSSEMFCYFSRNEISLKITCIYNLHLSYKLSKFDWVIHITTFFHGNIAQVSQFTHLLWLYILVEKQINLRRNGIFSEQLCKLSLTFWWFWYFTKIDIMVYFHYKSHWYLYSVFFFFFPHNLTSQ